MSGMSEMTGEQDQRRTASETVRAMNGFDEIAVSKMFAGGFGDLEGTLNLRALLFTSMRHDEGMTDADAYRQVMEMPAGSIEDVFTPEPDLPDDEQADRDHAYANFVVATGLAFTPDEYNTLTIGQREAVVREHNRAVSR